MRIHSIGITSKTATGRKDCYVRTTNYLLATVADHRSAVQRNDASKLIALLTLIQ